MPYTSDSWTFGHVPTTFKRLPTVNRWGVLHGFYSDQRDDQELSNSAPDMPSGVGFRILANRNIWRFPNNSSAIRFDRFRRSSGAWVSAVNGCAVTSAPTGALKADFGNTGKDDDGIQLDISADRSNSIYGASDTVQVAGLFAQYLIRYS